MQIKNNNNVFSRRNDREPSKTNAIKNSIINPYPLYQCPSCKVGYLG